MLRSIASAAAASAFSMSTVACTPAPSGLMTCFFFFFLAASSTLVMRCGRSGARNACVLAASASSNASFIMAAKIAVPGSRAAVPGAVRVLRQPMKPCAVQIALITVSATANGSAIARILQDLCLHPHICERAGWGVPMCWHGLPVRERWGRLRSGMGGLGEWGGAGAGPSPRKDPTLTGQGTEVRPELRSSRAPCNRERKHDD